MQIGVLVSGRGSNLEALLRAQEEGRLFAEVALVISDRPDAPALERARRHGVASLVEDPRSTRVRLSRDVEERFRDHLLARGVDWVILAGFFRIVGPVLLEAFPDRILNIHPSLLPAFRGLHAQRQALEHGVKIAGATVHLVSAEVDEGPILLQAAVPVWATDTEESLSRRILESEHRILVEAVNRIATGGFRREGPRIHWPQDVLLSPGSTHEEGATQR